MPRLASSLPVAESGLEFVILLSQPPEELRLWKGNTRLIQVPHNGGFFYVGIILDLKNCKKEYSKFLSYLFSFP